MFGKRSHKIEELITRGSTNTAIQFNDKVQSGQMWTSKGGLENVLDLEPGSAVTIVGKETEGKRDYYFVHGSYAIVPISAKTENGTAPMIPGVGYINSNEDVRDLHKNREFLGIVNPQYLIGIEDGKVSKVYQNGRFLDRYKDVKYNSSDERRMNLIRNIGYGVSGKVPVSMTDKIADEFRFPRPKPGDVVLGIAYASGTFMEYKGDNQAGAFSLLVSDEGDKLQVPYTLADMVATSKNSNKTPRELYAVEVVLGLSEKLGKSVI